MNNISVGREDMMVNVKPPFYKLDSKTYERISNIWTPEIQKILYDSNYASESNITLNIEK